MTHPILALETFRTQAEHQRFLETHSGELAGRREGERSLIQAGRESFAVAGVCQVCSRKVDFLVDYKYAYEVSGVLTPNWRERLVCPLCGLNGRMRATVHLLGEIVKPSRAARVYLTEQLTSLYRWAKDRFRAVAGSEWLGDAVALGATDASGVRNEDITHLTFADASFDLLVSLDVLEHVPDYRSALSECHRVLAPSGWLFLTCPFRMDLARNLVRAVVREDGEIAHREPPEYHGNPLSAAGSLAFYHFGWELLDDMRALGFRDVRACQYWSRELGYLGGEQLVFVARKDPSADRG